MSVSVVLENVAKKLGEAPHWVEKHNQLLFVDILHGDIHRLNTLTNEDRVLHLEGSASFVVPCQPGGYMVGNDQRMVHVGAESGELTIKAELKNKTTKFNDGKCDASGRLWLGTLGIPSDTAPFPRKAGGLFSRSQAEGFRQHLDGIDIANGMAWTRDSRTMFFIDSYPRQIYAFDFDLLNGSISNQRVLTDFNTCGENMGLPDGMTIDDQDKLWVACFNASKVVRIDSVTGQVLQEVQFPVKQITSCCFGGPDFSELYVTSARYDLSDEEVRTNQPLAGSLFKVTGLGVRGLPANIYRAKCG